MENKTNPLLASALDMFDDKRGNKMTLAFKYEETQKVVGSLECKVKEQAQRIEELNKALLALSKVYSDWPMVVRDEDEDLINRMISNAEGV